MPAMQPIAEPRNEKTHSSPYSYPPDIFLTETYPASAVRKSAPFARFISFGYPHLVAVSEIARRSMSHSCAASDIETRADDPHRKAFILNAERLCNSPRYRLAAAALSAVGRNLFKVARPVDKDRLHEHGSGLCVADNAEIIPAALAEPHLCAPVRNGNSLDISSHIAFAALSPVGEP